MSAGRWSVDAHAAVGVPTWTMPEETPVTPPPDTMPVYVSLDAKKHRFTADMTMEQTRFDVLSVSAGESCIEAEIEKRFVNNEDVIEQIYKHTKFNREFTFPFAPEWRNIPTTPDERLKVTVSWIKLQPEDVFIIKDNFETTVSKQRNHDTGFHIVLVVVNPDSQTTDLTVSFAKPEAFAGPKPTTKVLSGEVFERLLQSAYNFKQRGGSASEHGLPTC